VVIAGAFFPNYFSQGEIDEQLASKELSGNDPKTTILVPVSPLTKVIFSQNWDAHVQNTRAVGSY